MMDALPNGVREEIVKNTILFGMSLILMAGCATPDVKTGMWGYGPDEVGSTNGSLFTGFLNAQEADPLFANDKAKLIFLINAASPLTKDELPKYDPTKKEVTEKRNLSELEIHQLQAHLHYALNNVDAGKAQILRNNMLSVLIGRSDTKCANFQAGLQRLQSDSGFFFTSLTALLGGLGAIFAPAATVRALSGAAAITAGVGAAYSSSMFNEKTVSVLSKAIDAKRKRYLDTIEVNKTKPPNVYVFGDAIKDVATYHSYCNIVHAFAETEEALAKRDELRTALDAMRRTSEELGKKSFGFDFALDQTLTTRAFKRAKERQAALSANVNGLSNEVAQKKTDVATDRTLNEVLIKELPVIEKSLNDVNTSLNQVVDPKNEQASTGIADSLQTFLQEWTETPAGPERDLKEKQLIAKHAEAKQFASKIEDGLTDANNKYRRADAAFQNIKNARKLTVVNNVHATAIVKSKDGLDCDAERCDRNYPDTSEVELSVEPKTAGASLTTKWSDSCSGGKLKITTNATCTVDPSSP
jgi:hypothetical protein